MTSNFRLYCLGSFGLAVSVVINACRQRDQFYLICLYLVQSKPSIMVLGNFAFLLFILFGILVKSFFLGSLRDVEVEVILRFFFWFIV